MPYTPGYEEDGFLRQLDVEPGEAEPLAKNCTQAGVIESCLLIARRQ